MDVWFRLDEPPVASRKAAEDVEGGETRREAEEALGARGWI